MLVTLYHEYNSIIKKYLCCLSWKWNENEKLKGQLYELPVSQPVPEVREACFFKPDETGYS